MSTYYVPGIEPTLHMGPHLSNLSQQPTHSVSRCNLFTVPERSCKDQREVSEVVLD